MVLTATRELEVAPVAQVQVCVRPPRFTGIVTTKMCAIEPRELGDVVVWTVGELVGWFRLTIPIEFNVNIVCFNVESS